MITNEILQKIEKEVKSEFEKTNRILSFSQYLSLVEKDPEAHTRSSAKYVTDMFDHYGRHENGRFKLFDMEFDDPKFRVVGQSAVENDIYRALQGFNREGINNKLILLHGPNGSAKSSIVSCMIRGLEKYSESSEGAVYRFNWIFPVEKIVKGTLGLGSSHTGDHKKYETFAFLHDEEIATKIPCELKDHPLQLLPNKVRTDVLNGLSVKAKKKLYFSEYLLKGTLSHKSKLIFESLLTAYKGDLSKVLMHVQVERFFISKRYRTGAVTIEPQMHVDAASRQISIDRGMANLPTSLQGVSLFELTGDLVDANRGIVEFADLLKRPVDAFKYLLVTCETGTVNVGSSIACLDEIFIGSANELQLDAFKEYPDFMSFKARIELIRVPYLLSYSEEKKIYDVMVSKIAGQKHVTPHSTFIVSLWAVLTRLKKSSSANFDPPLGEIASALAPLEKAKFYDHGEMPDDLSADDKKLLKNSVSMLLEEYASVPNYEGRIGASAREIKSILFEAAANADYQTLSPIAIFKELEDFVKRTSEYEFLREDVKDGYHDCRAMIDTVREEYLSIIDREVKESMGLISSTQYEEYIRRYILNVSHLLKKEKIKNQMTGKLEDPDLTLIEDFEKTVEAPSGAGAERDNFRSNVISTIGAYALNNPKQPVEYAKVFPDFIKKLENHYFDKQKSNMRKISDTIALFGTDKEDKTSEHHRLALETIRSMISKFGYSEACAAQTVLYLIQNRY